MLDLHTTDEIIQRLARRIAEPDIVSFFRHEIVRIRSAGQPPFALRDFSPSLVAYVGVGSGASGLISLTVGFPFPLHTKFISSGPLFQSGSLGAGLAMHMQPLHRILRDAFFARFSRYGVITRLPTLSNFASLVKTQLSSPFDLAVYFDPFIFSGDSVSYASALQSIFSAIDASERVSLSINPSMNDVHSFCFISDDGVIAEILRETRKRKVRRMFLLVPNFIDNQWPLATKIIFGLLHELPELIVAMPGRNILVHSNYSRRAAYYLASSVDPSLWVMPREILINAATEPFFPLSAGAGRNTAPVSRIPRVFMHGCTSDRKKDLPPILIASIVEDLRRSFGSLADIEIGGGLPGSRQHKEWGKVLSRHCGPTTDWKMVRDLRLADLDKRISTSDCVITADTSVAHIAYHHRKSTICVYNRTAWDSRCVGSLFHHSAFGFAYAWPRFFVCITGPEDEFGHAQLATSIGLMLEILVGITSIRRAMALVICSIAERIELATQSKSPHSAALNLQRVLAEFSSYPVHGDSALSRCLLEWVRFEEIAPAFKNNCNRTTPLTELMLQFVRLHPATKLRALIRSGSILVQDE
jgi:hypothetical protein